MFFRHRQPLALRPEGLRRARFSLNRPVLATGELPPGPARAAILIHSQEAGGCGLAIGVRSVETGEAAVFVFEGELRSRGDVETALDAALSFGESMGFLFDDDSIAEGGLEARRSALERWRELVGPAETVDPPLPEPPGEPVPAPSGAAAGPCDRDARSGGGSEDELLLEDAVPDGESFPPDLPVRPLGGEAPAEPLRAAPVAGEAPPGDSRPLSAGPQHGRGTAPARDEAADRKPVAVSNALPLTKFRGRASAPPAPASAPDTPRGGHALGRIALRKRRRQETVSERPGLLVRIFGAF